MLSLSYFGIHKGQAEHIITKLDTISNQLVVSSMSFIINPTVQKLRQDTKLQTFSKSTMFPSSYELLHNLIKLEPTIPKHFRNF